MKGCTSPFVEGRVRSQPRAVTNREPQKAERTSGADEHQQNVEVRNDALPLVLARLLDRLLFYERLRDVIGVARREVGQELSEAQVEHQPAVVREFCR